MQRVAREAGGQCQRLEPGGHVTGRVRVHRGAAALVARVQCREQVDDLRAAHLAHDDPVRPHAQRLPHEVAQRHRAGALDVRRPRLEPHHVRVVGVELGAVLHHHDAVAAVAAAEQRAEPGGLAGAGAASDQDGQPRVDDRLHPRRDLHRERARLDQVVERERTPARDAQGQAGAGDRQRRQHGVNPGAVGEPCVDERCGVVEPAPAGCRQALGQPSHRGVVGERDVDPLDAAPPVDPHTIG